MSENPVIKAQNNRGYWLPVTVVVISRPLLVGALWSIYYANLLTVSIPVCMSFLYIKYSQRCRFKEFAFGTSNPSNCATVGIKFVAAVDDENFDVGCRM